MRLIVTAMKNEGPFILEWVAHHLVAGFDQFLVYTNDCDDGTDAIWQRLADMGLGAHERNNKIMARGVQKTALYHADAHPLTAKADWLSCLDVDEFVNVKCGEGRIDDLLSVLPEADMITLCWRRFGAAGIAGFQDKPITESFTRAAPEACPYPFHNYGFKSLWRADAGWRRIGVHRPLDPDPARVEALRVVNGAGTPLPRYRDKGLWLQPRSAGYKYVQLNHYGLRSAESFLVKVDRGLPNSKITDLDLGYWAERNFNQVEDISIHRVAPRMQAKLNELMEDATLRDLHQAACDWHRSRINALLQEAAPLKLFLRLLSTQTAVLPPRMAAQLNPLIARSWEMDRAHRKD
ncbi:MAG: glycosyltransferase family 2 protein [Pseudomonadota bacterium]